MLKLRCAALNLRKSHRLQPISSSIEHYELVSVGPVRQVDLSGIAGYPGTYAFYDYSRPIFAGETENLQHRIELHLRHGLPEWLGVNENDNLILKTLVLPTAKRDDRLAWLCGFITKEHPLLNYQKAA